VAAAEQGETVAPAPVQLAAAGAAAPAERASVEAAAGSAAALAEDSDELEVTAEELAAVDIEHPNGAGGAPLVRYHLHLRVIMALTIRTPWID
jgi:hypothetical protein